MRPLRLLVPVRAAFSALLVAGMIALPIPALAVPLNVTPSLTLDQVYDSNVFNSDGNEKGDFILRATPSVAFSLITPEAALNFSTYVSADKYYRYSELDKYDSSISLRLDSTTPIALTPRLRIAPNAYFVKTRDSFRRSQFLAQESTSGVVSSTSETGLHESRVYGGGLGIYYTLTQNTEFFAGGNVNKLQFLDNASLGYGYRSVSGTTSLSYKFTPVFALGIFGTGSNNDFESGDSSRIYAGGVTTSYAIARRYTVEARVGTSRAEQELVGAPRRHFWSPYALLNLQYAAPDVQVGCTGMIAQSGLSSYGSITREESLSLKVSKQLKEYWWGDLNGMFQRNVSQDPVRDVNLTSVLGAGTIRYQLRKWVSLHLTGVYFQQWSNGVSGQDLTRYSALVGITVGNTYNLLGVASAPPQNPLTINPQ